MFIFLKKDTKYKITNQQLIPHSQKDHGIKMLAKFSFFSTIVILLAQLCEPDKIQNTDRRISGIFQDLEHDLILSQNKAFIILDFDLSKLKFQFDEVRIMISKYKLGLNKRWNLKFTGINEERIRANSYLGVNSFRVKHFITIFRQKQQQSRYHPESHQNPSLLER